MLLLLGLTLTIVAYAGTLRFEFVYDDLPQIVSNPAVQSWRRVPGYFLHHVWSHIYPTWPGNYYRPLFLLWLRVNHAIFGLRPLGWHFSTVAAHLGVTAMVFWLARRITHDDVAAAVAATIFGLHPAHVETVAWVSGVSEPLLALLFIPAFVFYMNARERPQERVKWIALSLLMFALALLSKETAIVLPGLIFGYEWLGHGLPDNDAGESANAQPREASYSEPWAAKLERSVLATLPYAALGLVYLAVRQLVLKAFAHPEAHVPLSAVMLTWPSLLWLYARHLAALGRMSLFYDEGYVYHPGLVNFWLPLAAVAAIAACVVAWSRRSKPAALASLWLLLPLLPPLASIGIFGNGEIVHDRYLYLPSIGVAILVALAIERLPARGRLLQLPATEVAATLVLAIALGAATIVGSVHWANNLLLYYDGVQQAPRNVLARIHLGTEMLSRHDITSAMRLYYQAHDLAPDSWSANFVLGFINFGTGRFTEAEKWLRAGIRITPENPNQYLYLGLTLMNEGRFDEAAASIQHGADLWPQGPGFHYGLGLVAQKKGELRGAVSEFQKELAIDPTSGAWRNIAQIEAQMRAAQQR